LASILVIMVKAAAPWSGSVAMARS